MIIKERLKLDLSMVKEEVLTMVEFINESFSNIMEKQHMDPEFADILSQKTKALTDTKNILDTKNLANLMQTETDKFTRINTKKLRSAPLK